MSVLVDTCVWTRFLRVDSRHDDPVAQELAKLIRADVVHVLGCIRQELLSGAKPEGRFEHLRQYLRFYPDIPLEAEDYENAAKYFNTCRRNGVAGSNTDLLICAVAVKHGLRIFSTDSDFEHYGRHLPIRLHTFR